VSGNAPRSLRARRVCEPANPVRKGLAVVLVWKETREVVPYSVRRLTVPPASLVPRSAVPPEGRTYQRGLTLPWSCEATPKERPWRSPEGRTWLLESGGGLPGLEV
jgi:hypothetical protein